MDQRAILTERISTLLTGRTTPLVVAIDGRSGVGKSTLAEAVADSVSAAVIIGDDFYAGGDGAFWDAKTAAEKADHVIDWTRQRPVLDDLRNRRSASWHPFDWEAFDGSLHRTPITAEPADVIILEGAYSARPELADLVDLRILIEIPEDVRWQRLIGREGDSYVEEWDARWRSAEDHYFGTVVPKEGFDLVLGARG